MKIKVITHKCPQNHSCPSVRKCPVKAITQNGYTAPVIDEDKCIMCGKCVKICPKKAIIQE